MEVGQVPSDKVRVNPVCEGFVYLPDLRENIFGQLRLKHERHGDVTLNVPASLRIKTIEELIEKEAKGIKPPDDDTTFSEVCPFLA